RSSSGWPSRTSSGTWVGSTAWLARERLALLSSRRAEAQPCGKWWCLVIATSESNRETNNMADKRHGDGLVSVLMPCCGQLEYTKLSVSRVLKHSRPPFEVFFLDAGSL